MGMVCFFNSDHEIRLLRPILGTAFFPVFKGLVMTCLPKRIDNKMKMGDAESFRQRDVLGQNLWMRQLVDNAKRVNLILPAQ